MPQSIRNLCGIRSKQDLLQLLLEASKQLLNADMLKPSHNCDNTFSISLGDMTRLFFNINDEKIISFVFPFGIEHINNSFRIYGKQTDTIIDAEVISLLKCILNENMFSTTFYAPDSSMEDIIMETLEDLEPYNLELYSNIWSILQQLLLFEPGYIRYDHDKKHKRGKFHPEYHFDVNYSNQASFKLGLYNKKKIEFMIDFMNKKSNSLFLS